MLPPSLQKLIASFSKLPGVGRKTAERYAYFLLRNHRALGRELGETLMTLGENLTFCRECFMIAENALCPVCLNARREKRTICVVETIFDAEAIERSGEYQGCYHILHGRIAPLDNVTPDDLKIKELAARVERLARQDREIPLEVILATNPSSEGETTAVHISKLLKPFGIRLTRIATGIPVGASLEYADEITLGRAMKGRQEYD